MIFCFQNDLNALRFALSISRGIYNFICGLETTAVVSRPLFHEKGRSVQCILSSKIYSKSEEEMTHSHFLFANGKVIFYEYSYPLTASFMHLT